MASKNPYRYAAVIQKQRPCPECDELELGDGNRMDCGCLFEYVVGEYGSVRAARMACKKAISENRTGGDGAAPDGTWCVMDTEKEEEIVARS